MDKVSSYYPKYALSTVGRSIHKGLKMNDSTNKIISRLHRIEGQVRGVENMLREKKSVPLIIQQLEAVRSATTQAAASLLEDTVLQEGYQLSDQDVITLKRIIKKI